ncbi:hypothetical protein Ppb6_02423 [Photorhabdus australis subsp. thailandensis]|uniref:Uncharacterized protein n=1 Tax=Photorhabdus australis subsp. thailandensis TaxID=2805096 RepID=A0A1C0U338_9GAMM|nr:hypothetical protein [Photorhabdus australis]OCQ52349.1 hypothetical protein Ppb6_02423 [Photorhabdus australis subsp. thailandensis]
MKTWSLHEAVNKLTGQSQTRTPMQRQIDAAVPVYHAVPLPLPMAILL